MKYGIKQTMHKITAAILTVLCVLGASAVPALAATEPIEPIKSTEEKVVRVGSPENIYDEADKWGNRSGYGYEYLQKISAYTGWKYEYVPCTWEDCFDKLKNGEIDILEAISYTDERAEAMSFSDMPISEEKYYIFAELGNTELSLSDLSTFEGKNIGVLLDHLPEAVLNEWTQKNCLHMNFVNIATKEQTIERMQNGEIDCFVSVEAAFWGEYGIAPIITIGGSDIHFAFRKDSTELKAKVDNAILRISEEHPFFSSDLYKKYFSDTKIPVLTKEESAWLASHGAIRVGYRKDDGAVSTYHPDTGEVTGVIKDFIRNAENCLYGHTLEFELIGYDTRPEMSEALHRGEIDMIFYVSQNLNSAEKMGYDLSDTTWSSSMAVVTARDYVDLAAENTVAVIKGRASLKAYITSNFPEWKFAEYDTQEDAVNAVRRGWADCVVMDSGEAANYTKGGKLRSFVLAEPSNASFAVEHGNINLLSILNKVLETTSTSKTDGLLNMHKGELKKVSMGDFIRDNLLVFLIVVAVLFLAMLFLLRDALHAKRRATIAQKQAEAANRSKTVFLNNMSHDIRTPINGIIGMLSIMSKAKDDPELMDDCMQKIDCSSKLLLSLINDVLDLAKLETNEVVLKNESVNLNSVCEEIGTSVYFQAESAGITLEEEHDDYSNMFVFTSSLHLKKILINLFTNAVKYNKPDGKIYMSMKTVERTEGSILCEFKIADTGIGMSEDFVQNKLFVPFVQADASARSNYMGTGLGMPIVKNLVEKMGGTISVESRLGEGSTFTVRLPFELDPEGKTEEQDKIGDCSINGMNLLLAEDNDLNTEIAKVLLEDEGAAVTTVENGEKALEAFRDSPAGTFDAILMDVMMPVMDGLSATKAIRSLDRPDAKEIPIIAMTANAFAEDAEKCIAAGMNAHLAKPLDIESIKKTLCKYTNRN